MHKNISQRPDWDTYYFDSTYFLTRCCIKMLFYFWFIFKQNLYIFNQNNADCSNLYFVGDSSHDLSFWLVKWLGVKQLGSNTTVIQQCNFEKMIKLRIYLSWWHWNLSFLECQDWLIYIDWILPTFDRIRLGDSKIMPARSVSVTDTWVQ